jgi:cobalt-zinc-cadmium efflux system membrane fusion protein
MIQKYPPHENLADVREPIVAHRDRGANTGPRLKPRKWTRYLVWGAGVAAAILIGVFWFTGEPPKPGQPVADKPPVATFQDNALKLDDQAKTALGLCTRRVEPQTQPIRLELLGTTKYDEDTLTKVRVMFKGRVERVHVVLGQRVQIGQPLIDLYSTELAEAKSTFEIEHLQWMYEKQLLDTRAQLRKSNAIPEQLFLETQNSEMRNRREYEVARDKLLVYGLTDQEIDNVEHEQGQQKARLTLRSPSEGIVIKRDVVPGNLYEQDDTLLVIAPLDHLRVWGNVFESDLDLVKIGQAWEIQFPYLTERIQGKVEYIANEVDPETRAVRLRTSIPNVAGNLKSDMLVRGTLEIPPKPGRTVIPRSALIVEDGRYFAFVQSATDPTKYERRSLNVAQEKEDHVVVESGLLPGDEVVVVGGLILAQLYDDLQIARTGTPPGTNTGLD